MIVHFIDKDHFYLPKEDERMKQRVNEFYHRITCKQTYHRLDVFYPEGRIVLSDDGLHYTDKRSSVTCSKCLMRMHVKDYIINRRFLSFGTTFLSNVSQEIKYESS